MKVEVNTIQEFCSELAVEAAANRVRQHIVRIRIDAIPEQPEEVSFEVRLWATALIGPCSQSDTDEDMYILELGEICGSDIDGDSDGSDAAADHYGKIAAVADEHGLHLRSGKIEMF